MLFKPYSDTPTPRHIVQDLEVEEEWDSRVETPRASTSWQAPEHSALVVLPSHLAVVVEALGRWQTVATITVAYPTVPQLEQTLDEFDEETQLYLPAAGARHAHSTRTIPIQQSEDLPALFAVVMPATAEPMAQHAVGNAVAGAARLVLTIGVSSLPSGLLVAQLVLHGAALLEHVAAMTPPLLFTGIAAATIAACNSTATPCAALAVRGEGNAGHEKIGADEMMDLCLVVAARLELPSAYTKTAASRIRKLFSGIVSSLGMYL